MRPSRPRPVSAEDPLERFDCGNRALNSWLVERALRNEHSGDSRTYVSIDLDSGNVLGYYSLAAWSVSHDQVGGWMKRNAPDPISVVLLGRLAVAVEAEGKGLGRSLLADALAKANAAGEVLGARALVAEAIDEQAQRFYSHAGLWQSPSRPDLFAAPLERQSGA